MKQLPGKTKRSIWTAIIVLVIAGFFLWQNNSLTVSEFVYESARVPAEFRGFKIVQISDLHNKKFGREQETLLAQIKKLSPAVIFITGDLVDRRKYDLDAAMVFVKGAVRIAPTYYVSGNHEAWSGKYSEIRERLTEAGVIVMDDASIALGEGGGSIQLLGLSDPDFLTSDYMEGTDLSKIQRQLNSWAGDEPGRTPCGYLEGKRACGTDTGFKILLSHRPELFDLYCEADIDLIFAGHAHGGQLRIPFGGGLVAPDQGLFPKYTSGSYRESSSTMYVSRGLGNSIIPIRIFNRPEIISVVLK